MAADRLIIELDAEGALLRRLDQAIRQVDAPDELMENLGAILESNIQYRFDAKQDPSGADWAPLRPETLAKKDGRGSTLIETALMRQSLASNSGSDWVEVGFGDPKAAYHEFGTERSGRQAVPRRGLLTAEPEDGELSAGDRNDIEAEISRFLGSAFR